MTHSLRVALVVATSMVSGLLLALVVSAIEIETGVAISGISIAFVMPVGAVACGFVAAGGYYAASRAFHVRPGPEMLLLPLATSVVSFIAAHWFTFRRFEIGGGRPLADVMSFVDYLQAVITDSGVSSGSNAAVSRLGSMGYAVAAIEVIGFAAGGWLAANALQTKPWCAASLRFLERVDHRKQRFEHQGPFHHAMAEVVQLVEADESVAACATLPAKRPTMRAYRKGRFALTLDRYECRKCGCDHSIVTTHERVKHKWQQTSRSAIHPQPVDGFVRLVR